MKTICVKYKTAEFSIKSSYHPKYQMHGITARSVLPDMKYQALACQIEFLVGIAIDFNKQKV